MTTNNKNGICNNCLLKSNYTSNVSKHFNCPGRFDVGIAQSAAPAAVASGNVTSSIVLPPRDGRFPVKQFSVELPLRPWSNYSFRVAGRNALGTGQFGRPTDQLCGHTTCHTPPVKPYRNPQGVCTNLTSYKGRLHVLWEVGQPLHRLAVLKADGSRFVSQ